MRPWLFCVALASCAGSTHSPAPSVPPAAPPAVTAPEPAAPAPAPPVVSIVDAPYPHEYDGKRANPGMASLRAVNEHEAWLELKVMGGTSYDAIVDLDTGCVTETFDLDGAGAVLKALSVRDLDFEPALAREPMRSRIGAHLARLARFSDIEVSAVMVHGRSDGVFAMSSDHRRLAVNVNGGVFLSLDGGGSWSFASVARHQADDVRFVTDRYLVYNAYLPPVRGVKEKENRSQVEVLDVEAPFPQKPGVVETTSFTPLRGLFYAPTVERCIYELDAAAHALRKRGCLAGPKTAPGTFFSPSMSPSGLFVSEIQGDFQATRGFVTALADASKPRALKGGFDLHNASVGPDDEGRFAWEGKRGILRIDGGPEGMHEEKLVGAPLGFDRSGHALMFVQPELVRPHLPGQLMPPAKGVLDDRKCSLIARSH